MNNDPKENLLDIHASATWRVWKSHHNHCVQCAQSNHRTPPLTQLCARGQASWEEYDIAESRLNDYRIGRRAAATAVTEKTS